MADRYISAPAVRRCGVGLATLALSVSALTADAAPIGVSAFAGSFLNPVGGAITTNVDSPGSALDVIDWGDVNGTSGYRFLPGTDIPSLAVGTPFLLGTFTHVNRPITAGTAITAVDYALSFSFTGLPPVINLLLHFDHDETPNDPALCAPLTDATGACPDVVQASVPAVNLPLTGDDGLQYYFNLVGFSLDGTTPESTFLSLERSTNSVGLYGLVTSEPVLIPNPEPATLALLGSGLAGAVAARRRARRR